MVSRAVVSTTTVPLHYGMSTLAATVPYLQHSLEHLLRALLCTFYCAHHLAGRVVSLLLSQYSRLHLRIVLSNLKTASAATVGTDSHCRYVQRQEVRTATVDACRHHLSKHTAYGGRLYCICWQAPLHLLAGSTAFAGRLRCICWQALPHLGPHPLRHLRLLARLLLRQLLARHLGAVAEAGAGLGAGLGWGRPGRSGR